MREGPRNLLLVVLVCVGAGCEALQPAPAWHSSPQPAPSPSDSEDQGAVEVGPPAPPEPMASATADGLSEDAERLLERAGMILEALDAGSYPLAAQETQRLSATFPGNAGALLIQVLFERRLAQLKSGDAGAASASLTAKRHEAQAKTLVKQGRNEDARVLLERAHALDPENAEIADSLVSLLKQMGLELYGDGDAIQAAELWRRAQEIKPDDAEVQRFLRRADTVKGKI
jgi:tetratricopeptide (TPR) repeat protein